MKNTQKIVSRAIILVCLSDRCALEENIIEGRKYTKSEREKQREAIRNWLDNTGYMKYATDTERELFDKKIGAVHKNNLLQYQVQYEAVEPCLWSLGLVDQLSDYENFVLEDFHPILQIGMNHSYERVIAACKPRESKEIELQTEIAMIWNWRAREAYNPIFKEKYITDVIPNILGEQYTEILSHMNCLDVNGKDLLVQNRLFADLSSMEKERIKMISVWRQHAFEWIIGNDLWDVVEENT